MSNKTWNQLYAFGNKKNDVIKDDNNRKFIPNSGICPDCHKEMLKASNGWNCWECKIHLPKMKKIK